MQNFYDYYKVEGVRDINEDVALSKKSPKLALSTNKYFKVKQIHNSSVLWDMGVDAVLEDNEKLTNLLETKNAILWNVDKLLLRRAKKLSSSGLGNFSDKIPMAQQNTRLSHYLSTYLTARLPQDDTKVVTGFVYGKTDESKLLHSWVETSIDEKELVIDITKDIVIDKETYYNLLVNSVISETQKEQIIKDSKLIYPYIRDKRLSFESYLVDREEILKRISNIVKEPENENI